MRPGRRTAQMILLKPKYAIAALLAFIVCMGAFLLPVYASTGGGYGDVPAVEINGVVGEAANETMIVNASWINDEMLLIDVINLETETITSVALRLSDLVADAGNSPYILIQAADLDGNLSGVIQINNPFYMPYPGNTGTGTGAGSEGEGTAEQNTVPEVSPEIPDGAEVPDAPENADTDANDYENGANNGADTSQIGLTPDGTGTVVDNVVTQNDIEFFTVFSEEGNVFFLVVDRQRSTDNVYLLNAVTESDLMALAERSGNPIEDNNVSAIPPIYTPEPEPPVENNPDPEPEYIPEPEPQPAGGSGNGNIIFILVAAVAIGGAAYYFKIVRPKKNSAYDDDDDFDDSEFDESSEDESGDFEDYETEDGSDE